MYDYYKQLILLSLISSLLFINSCKRRADIPTSDSKQLISAADPASFKTNILKLLENYHSKRKGEVIYGQIKILEDNTFGEAIDFVTGETRDFLRLSHLLHNS